MIKTSKIFAMTHSGKTVRTKCNVSLQLNVFCFADKLCLCSFLGVQLVNVVNFKKNSSANSHFFVLTSLLEASFKVFFGVVFADVLFVRFYDHVCLFTFRR